jgi:hypothetical protein
MTTIAYKKPKAAPGLAYDARHFPENHDVHRDVHDVQKAGEKSVKQLLTLFSVFGYYGVQQQIVLQNNCLIFKQRDAR